MRGLRPERSRGRISSAVVWWHAIHMTAAPLLHRLWQFSRLRLPCGFALPL
jgi:hypothetical protein